jgi:hypothetical protein
MTFLLCFASKHHTTIALKKLGNHNSLTPITVGPFQNINVRYFYTTRPTMNDSYSGVCNQVGSRKFVHLNFASIQIFFKLYMLQQMKFIHKNRNRTGQIAMCKHPFSNSKLMVG